MSEYLNVTPGPYIRTPTSQLATFLNTVITGTSVAQFETYLANYIQANPPAALPLTAINPDFEANKAEMANVLAATQSWADIITSGIGQTVAEMVATTATYNQMGIEKAVQESIIDTAVLDSSIYGITRMLGVKIQRRIPGNLPVNIYAPISNTITQSIPAYNQLQVGGINYFNRAAIIIPASPHWAASTAKLVNNTVYPNTANGFTYICTVAGTTGLTEPIWPTTTGSSVVDGGVTWLINSSSQAVISTTLYEGQLNTVSFTASGTPFQIVEFGNNDFTISNLDVNVTVNNIAYSPTIDPASGFNIGLWEFNSSSLVFEETTNAVGNVEIKFGNGIYGALPVAGATINVTFVLTNGQEGNANLNGQTISCAAYNTFSGVATGSTTQGSDQLSAFDYKALGPGLFAAKYRATTYTDYQSIATTYPGVIDAQFLGQSVFAPSNLAYMMNVQAVLLTNTVWSSTQWNNFVTYMTNLGCVNIVLLQVVPTGVVLNVSANVYCFANANLTTIQNQIIANLQAAFTLGVGSLGYSWYESDIEGIIANSSPLVDYYDLTLPTSDTTITGTQYITLGTVTLNMAYSTRSIKN